MRVKMESREESTLDYAKSGEICYFSKIRKIITLITPMQSDNIMTIADVAGYLRVPEETIEDWARKGKIPGGKLGDTYQFERRQIENWVDQWLGLRCPVGPEQGWIDLSDLIAPGRVLLLKQLKKRAALNSLIDRLALLPGVGDRGELAEAIFRREKLMSTGIGSGIGVPHVRLASIADIAVAIGICPEGVADYESLDGEPVKIICMIVSGAGQQVLYLKTLAAICNRFRHPGLRGKIMNSDSPDTVYRLLIDKLPAE